MIKVKDGYAKLIGTTYQGSATQVLLSNGGDLEYSASSKASTLVQRNASQHIYATYFNSAISDEALTDIGSVYVRNTSDTFIRRVSKTQFYSILDDKFVTLDTTQSITGAKTFSTSVRFANNASIIQNQGDTSNYTTILKWYKNGASRNTYDPSIGQHNTGGNGNGSICILPYPTETRPWGGTVGLFISKGVLKLDGKSVALAENYYTKTESDERYVNVTGDTMTGPLIVKAAITGTQLISTIATGTSPLKVTSTTVVTNLNSDLLDGLHETSFFRARGDQSIASSVPTTTELATSNNLCGSWNVKYTGASGHLVQFNAGSGSTRYMQFYSTHSGSLYWRNSTDSTLNTKSWKTIVDSANYTGIVLKIGTATKGSATLPIYLNAGTPTACSTTLGVSITGNAATANRILSHTISDTLANKTTPGYLYHAGGGNSVADKPSGVGAFGVFTMQTASGWYGQILMSSNTSTGLYWRTATTLSGGWKKILDSSNYTAYINPANFVTALGTSGNYLTWTKNGVVNNLTVPYATASSRINSSSSVQNTGLTYYSSGGFVVGGTAAGGQWGMPSDSQDAAYKNGQCLRMYWGSTHYTDILSGPNNMGTTHGLYMRQIVDGAVATGTFPGGWRLLLDSYNYQRYGDTRYVTLTTNQTVSGIKTFSKQQKFTVATGTSPFTVSSTTVVGNLNADMVDGYHSSKLFRSFGGVSIDFNFSDDNNNNGLYYLHSNYTQSNKNGITYGSLMNFSSSASSWQIISGNDARLYYRNRWWSGGGGAWSAWKTIAYTSDIPSSLKNPYSLTLQTNGSTQTTYDGSSAKTFNVTVQNAGSGLLHNSLTITLADTTTDSGWSMINSSYNGFILKSIRTEASTPSWILGNYSAGICFGGADTKGVISCAYGTPSIRFAGGNSSKPVWWMGITGSRGVTYNLADFAKGNAGASNRGVYVTNGTVTAMTYYLNATVNSGEPSKLAYYSDTNSIDDYTRTVGSFTTPMYLSEGVPAVCGGVVIKYWAIYTINSINSTITFTRDAGNYLFLTSITRMRDNGNGAYCVYCSYPSGYSWRNTIIWGSGSNASGVTFPEINGSLYVSTSSGGSNYFYVRTADDASTNNGKFRLFMIWF